MTVAQFFIVALVVLVSFLAIRTIHRRLSLTRAERAFLSVAAGQDIDRARAMDFVNLARAKGTTAMEEASAEAQARRDNELRETLKWARIAVMERAARDEFARLKQESDLKSIQEISDSADAAGITAVNQHVKPGGPLADDSPIATNIAALQVLIESCNADLVSIPPGEEYVTRMGRVAGRVVNSE